VVCSLEAAVAAWAICEENRQKSQHYVSSQLLPEEGKCVSKLYIVW